MDSTTATVDESTENSTTADDETRDTETEMVTMPKQEADALRRQTAEARKAARKAEAEAARAAEEKAKQDGNFKAAAEAAEKRAQEAEQRAIDLERTQRITQIASRLKFRDPGDVRHLLSEDVLDDDRELERALKAIKRDKPYLAEPDGRRSGGAIDESSSGSVDMNTALRRAAGRA